MLVLTRHVDESIEIGSDVIVTLLAIRGDKVRLGIAAPIETAVHRSEIADRIAVNGDGKPVPPHRHADEITSLRNALHLVMGRLKPDPAGGQTARLTTAERQTLERALAGGGRS